MILFDYLELYFRSFNFETVVYCNNKVITSLAVIG